MLKVSVGELHPNDNDNLKNLFTDTKTRSSVLLLLSVSLSFFAVFFPYRQDFQVGYPNKCIK